MAKLAELLLIIGLFSGYVYCASYGVTPLNSTQAPNQTETVIVTNTTRITRVNVTIARDGRLLLPEINTCRIEENQVAGEWACQNGDIIHCNKLCNGPVDCADGSDEIQVSCGIVFCRETGFRCAYGGCIRAELECDGKEDCADGSDEKTLNCPGVLETFKFSGTCDNGFFQCDNGDCIHDDAVCSGGAQCRDGSDETEFVCSTNYCPESAFRCEYGACIISEAKCDGEKDCADGSDEKNCTESLTAQFEATTEKPTMTTTTTTANGVTYETAAVHVATTMGPSAFSIGNENSLTDNSNAFGAFSVANENSTPSGAFGAFSSDNGFPPPSNSFAPSSSGDIGDRTLSGAPNSQNNFISPELVNEFHSLRKQVLGFGLRLLDNFQTFPPFLQVGDSGALNMPTLRLDATPDEMRHIASSYKEIILRQEREIVALKSLIREIQLRLLFESRLPPTTDVDQSGLQNTAGSGSRIQGLTMADFGPSTSPEEMRRIALSYREIILRQEKEIVDLRDKQLELELRLLGDNQDVPASNDSSEPENVPQIGAPRESVPEDLDRQKESLIDKDDMSLTSRGAGDRESGDCFVPSLDNGRVLDKFNRDVKMFVKNGEEIKFKCSTGTSLIGVNSTSCINGELLSKVPICSNMCSGVPLNTLSVQAECRSPNGDQITCTSLLPPNTVAILTCKVGYKQPDHDVPDAYKCMDDGQWNAHVYKCIPICGEISDGRGLIVGGTQSNISQVPWHAAVYEDMGTGKMEQICGGTILNPTAIVSAAHCFWDDQSGMMKDASLYQVAVGKTLRDFNAQEPTTKMHQVTGIKIYEQYRNYEGLYVSDIAVVRLRQPIIFQSYIKPICVEYNLKGNQRYTPPGVVGRVAGWGLTASGGQPSAVLKTIDLPTVDYNTCLNQSPVEFKPFITTDKFCGGFTTGESVCKGDSGGGFVIPKPSNEKMVYFLRGIVSVGPIKEGSCDNNRYSAFTDIQQHTQFLYEFVGL